MKKAMGRKETWFEFARAANKMQSLFVRTKILPSRVSPEDSMALLNGVRARISGCVIDKYGESPQN
jgi:hypothetical protein